MNGKKSLSNSISSSWYDALRDEYQPEHIRILLIAESPPDPGERVRRFFYSPHLKIDNLYRGVALALYGADPLFNLKDKPSVLERLRHDGLWLIDAVDEPINRWKSSEKRLAVRNGLPRLIERCLSLNPSKGVIICHGRVYGQTANSLRNAGVNVLHTQPLPFPLGNFRAEFIAGFRDCL